MGFSTAELREAAAAETAVRLAELKAPQATQSLDEAASSIRVLAVVTPKPFDAEDYRPDGHGGFTHRKTGDHLEGYQFRQLRDASAADTSANDAGAVDSAPELTAAETSEIVRVGAGDDRRASGGVENAQEASPVESTDDGVEAAWDAHVAPVERTGGSDEEFVLMQEDEAQRQREADGEGPEDPPEDDFPVPAAVVDDSELDQPTPDKEQPVSNPQTTLAGDSEALAKLLRGSTDLSEATTDPAMAQLAATTAQATAGMRSGAQQLEDRADLANRLLDEAAARAGYPIVEKTAAAVHAKGLAESAESTPEAHPALAAFVEVAVEEANLLRDMVSLARDGSDADRTALSSILHVAQFVDAAVDPRSWTARIQARLLDIANRDVDVAEVNGEVAQLLLTGIPHFEAKGLIINENARLSAKHDLVTRPILGVIKAMQGIMTTKITERTPAQAKLIVETRALLTMPTGSPEDVVVALQEVAHQFALESQNAEILDQLQALRQQKAEAVTSTTAAEDLARHGKRLATPADQMAAIMAPFAQSTTTEPATAQPETAPVADARAARIKALGDLLTGFMAAKVLTQPDSTDRDAVLDIWEQQIKALDPDTEAYVQKIVAKMTPGTDALAVINEAIEQLGPAQQAVPDNHAPVQTAAFGVPGVVTAVQGDLSGSAIEQEEAAAAPTAEAEVERLALEHVQMAASAPTPTPAAPVPTSPVQPSSQQASIETKPEEPNEDTSGDNWTQELINRAIQRAHRPPTEVELRNISARALTGIKPLDISEVFPQS